MSNDQLSKAGITPAARTYSLVLLTVVYMFNFIDRQILSILVPAIKEEFQVSDVWMGAMTGTVFVIFYVGLGVPIARLADRWSRRNIIAIALTIWSGMTALSGLAQNFWHMFLARIGVGIGEAGGNPPSHSIIADLYPPERRAAAMGFFSLGVSMGVMLAFVGGGWVVENIGWRQAFFIVGIPGLLLAVLVRLTLTDPPRGASEARTDSGKQPPMKDVVSFLVARKSFLYLAVGAGVSSLVGYALVSWVPAFVNRSYGLGLAEIGLWLGVIYGIFGGLGFFMGGWFADRIAQRSNRKALLFIAASTMLGGLLYVIAFMSESVTATFALFALPSVVSNFYLATVFAQTQALVSLRMRAVASSIMLFILNIIGLGLGPLLAGALSDYLTTGYGADGLRYSLFSLTIVMTPIAAACYFMAAKYIESDLARATEAD
ncbi:MAG: MFS transporter [Pseudomonadota bacterium]